MREIKFRQWSSDRFHYWGCNSDNFTSPLSNRLDIQSEQFTGLHDKNGKEIYEWDILKNPDYEEAFVVEYHEGVAGYVGWGDDKIAGCYLITGDEIEIIGNIHENPELLEHEE